MKADGQIVAMTGDGVNDAPALKRSDVGVAVGQRGSDVTREVADLVLLDDNVASIVGAIEEGRGIYENIQTFVRYTFSTNVALMLLIVVGAVGSYVEGLRDASGVLLLPLTALQLLWVNFLGDGPPALALALDRTPGVMSRPPRPAKSDLLDAASKRFIIVTRDQGAPRDPPAPRVAAPRGHARGDPDGHLPLRVDRKARVRLPSAQAHARATGESRAARLYRPRDRAPDPHRHRAGSPAKKISEVAAKASSVATDAGDKVEGMAKKGEHRLHETTEKARHVVDEVATKVAHSAEETARKVVHSAKEVATKAEHHRQELTNKAGDKPKAK